MKAIYLRKSRQGDEQDALSTHRSVLERICNQHGWTYDIYEEIASGDSDKQELNRLLDNITEYDAILCMDIDRLSRDKVEAFEIQAILMTHGVKVITPTGEYNLADESADMMYSIKAIFASAELKKTKKRMKDGKINRFKNGEYSLGKAPFGYTVENKKLVVNDEEAQIVKRIFELSALGYGASKIAGKTGISRHNVNCILQNKVYIGQVIAKFGDEILVQSCEPIIDIERFVNAQEELKRRVRNDSRTRGTIRSIVQGLCRCSICGSQMAISKTYTNFVKCNTDHCPTNGIRVDFVEDHILHELETTTDVLNDVLADRVSRSGADTLGTEINSLRGQLEGLKSKLKRTKDLYMDGDLEKADYREKKSILDREISDMSLKLQSLEMKQANSDIQELKSMITELGLLHEKSIEDQHTVISRLIDKIEYHRVIPKGVNRREALETHPPSLNIVWREF